MTANPFEFVTELTAAEQAALPAGDHLMLNERQTRNLLHAPSGERPRIYAFLERGASAGQIARIASLQALDELHDNIGCAWASSTTIADLVKQAS